MEEAARNSAEKARLEAEEARVEAEKIRLEEEAKKKMVELEQTKELTIYRN